MGAYILPYPREQKEDWGTRPYAKQGVFGFRIAFILQRLFMSPEYVNTADGVKYYR